MIIEAGMLRYENKVGIRDMKGDAEGKQVGVSNSVAKSTLKFRDRVDTIDLEIKRSLLERGLKTVVGLDKKSFIVSDSTRGSKVLGKRSRDKNHGRRNTSVPRRGVTFW